MNVEAIKSVLLWSVAVNYGVVVLWFAIFALAHDGLYRLHTRWFRLSVETFDVLHYTGMGLYKIGVLLFNVAPLAALYLVA